MTEEQEYINKLLYHIDSLEQQNKILSEALEWYANPMSYEFTITNIRPVNQDNGWLAKNALQQILQGEDEGE